MNKFEEGQYIIYRNGDSFQLGKIKRVVDDGAFVWYHSGETAAKTHFDDMYPIDNSYHIKKTELGGAN